METSLQTFRRSAIKYVTDGELDKARIMVAAILGTVSTERSEEAFARKSLADLFTADADKIKMILRIAYDRALRIEQRRKNEAMESNRPRFGIRPNWG